MQGAMHEHIRRAHIQCNVWQQVLIVHPTILEPTSLDWSQKTGVGELMPVLTRVPLAPESVLEMVWSSVDASQVYAVDVAHAKIIICPVQSCAPVKLILSTVLIMQMTMLLIQTYPT